MSPSRATEKRAWMEVLPDHLGEPQRHRLADPAGQNIEGHQLAHGQVAGNDQLSGAEAQEIPAIRLTLLTNCTLLLEPYCRSRAGPGSSPPRSRRSFCSSTAAASAARPAIALRSLDPGDGTPPERPGSRRRARNFSSSSRRNTGVAPADDPDIEREIRPARCRSAAANRGTSRRETPKGEEQIDHQGQRQAQSFPAT